MLSSVIKWKYFPRYWPFVGNSPVTGEFLSQMPVTWSFDIFLYMPKQTVEWTIESPVIWDTIALIITSLYWNTGYTRTMFNDSETEQCCVYTVNMFPVFSAEDIQLLKIGSSTQDMRCRCDASSLLYTNAFYGGLPQFCLWCYNICCDICISPKWKVQSRVVKPKWSLYRNI